MPNYSILASTFESSLRTALVKESVQAIPEFHIKRDNGTSFRVDLYIASPQRAIVETKVFIKGSFNDLLRKATKNLEAARNEFDGHVVCFLVVLDQNSQIADASCDIDWMEIVIVSGFKAANTAAAEISKRLFRTIPVDKLAAITRNELNDRLNDTGVLADVLVNFRTRISQQSFQMLRLETGNFYREYESGHYTTAALCIGRTLEFIVYTLAKAWGVSINKRSIAVLAELEQKFQKLSVAIIDYAYAEGEADKTKAQNKLNQMLIEFSGSMTKSILEMHNDHQKIDTDNPITVPTILRDIKKKYQKIDTVRNEIDKLSLSDAIINNLKMRNRAAHADTSGNRTEYCKSDIDSMLENLRTILFHFGNIADAIENSGY